MTKVTKISLAWNGGRNSLLYLNCDRVKSGRNFGRKYFSISRNKARNANDGRIQYYNNNNINNWKLKIP